jgi:hypothetical protein
MFLNAFFFLFLRAFCLFYNIIKKKKIYLFLVNLVMTNIYYKNILIPLIISVIFFQYKEQNRKNTIIMITVFTL